LAIISITSGIIGGKIIGCLLLPQSRVMFASVAWRCPCRLAVQRVTARLYLEFDSTEFNRFFDLSSSVGVTLFQQKQQKHTTNQAKEKPKFLPLRRYIPLLSILFTL
jgi:hypothetical protein